MSLIESLTNLVARMIAMILWSLGYPCFAPLTGKYHVGAIQTRLPGSVACQIHYPAKPITKQDVFVSYWRPKAVDGMGDYSQTGPAPFQLLALKQHPCLMNAEPASNRKFPVVLFSHGLGGCMEMYTQLCQQIASYGFVVVAMEHEDGSGAFAETSLGKPILYTRPDDTAYRPDARQKAVEFRRPFLKQRVEETTSVLHNLLLNEPQDTRPEVQQILDAIDPSKGISLVGHSFGGATMAVAAQKYLSEAATNALFVPKSVCLLDVWAFAMEDKALDQGLPLPTLSILSEEWLTNPEAAPVDRFLPRCPNASAFFIPRSLHISFSDAVNWLPRFIGSKMELQGKTEKTHDTIPTAAHACVQHIQSALNSDSNTCQPMTNSGLLQEYDIQVWSKKKGGHHA